MASPEMASPEAGRDNDSERLEPNHPEPACQEAQKWIEVSDRGSEVWWGGCFYSIAGTEMGHTVTYWGYKYIALQHRCIVTCCGDDAVSCYRVGTTGSRPHVWTNRVKSFAHVCLLVKFNTRSQHRGGTFKHHQTRLNINHNHTVKRRVAVYPLTVEELVFYSPG